MKYKQSLYLVLAGIIFLSLTGCSEAKNTTDLRAQDVPTGTEQITFVELGSVKCIPCKQMQPIMDEIEEQYAGKVKVVFHDVWSKDGKPYGKEYGIRLIPTQVFLDKEGNEVARHEGFFPKAEIEKILADNGVTQ
ncbi:thioredoxin family protein [Desulfosarcina sp.]|nr:thioredoxin family protein [Desulfosarcina sp.]